MKTIKIEVERIDEFEIKVNFQNPELRKIITEYNEHICDIESDEEFIEHLCVSITRKGIMAFYEGFGYVKTFRDGEELYNYHVENTPCEYLQGVEVHLLTEEEYNVV